MPGPKNIQHNALCSYPLKLEIQKFGKVKAQFSLNFVPNFKILVLTGKELHKDWGKIMFFWTFVKNVSYFVKKPDVGARETSNFPETQITLC